MHCTLFLYTWFHELVPAVAYHFCLNLPATFSQPRTNKFSQLCMLATLAKAQGVFPAASLPLSTMCDLPYSCRTGNLKIKCTTAPTRSASRSSNTHRGRDRNRDGRGTGCFFFNLTPLFPLYASLFGT